jgi:L-threonylcarbamoyladenylate synthase
MSDYTKDIEKCLATLKNGGTILYPTDTIWGIGCDATNAAAVAKIYAIKKRDEKKSMIILVAHENDIKNYVQEPDEKIKTLFANTERPLTIIYPAAKNLAANLINEDGTIAIRIVKDAFCEYVIKTFGKPIVSTSANISGEETAKHFGGISAEIKNNVDYIVEQRQKERGNAAASKIVKWDGDKIVVIRE